MSKEADINFKVKLDSENAPMDILWSASEAETEGFQSCDALMISMWDRSEKNTMSIDLWTKEMEVGEMNAHYYYMMMKMADTYLRATNNEDLAQMMRDFANDFASKVEDFATKEG